MLKKHFDSTGLYKEKPAASLPYRERYLTELRRVIARRRKEAAAARAAFFRPDFSSPQAYEASATALRERYRAMLGWPLSEDHAALGVPRATVKRVAHDRLGMLSRVWIEVLPGFHLYGLLFLPPGEGRVPLVLSQHGGLGTPEVCSGLHPSENYNDMTRRVVARGVAAFAPQLLLWRDLFGPKMDRKLIDAELRQVGGSITALEIYALQRSLDYLVTRPEVDAARIGMVGLSYGGFYTLYTAAAEPRIRAALCSCFFGDRERYPSTDWAWPNASRTFLDPEVASLICPRALFIEAGRRDTIFDWKTMRRPAARVRCTYARLGLSARFRFRVFEGPHEFCKDDEGINFVMRQLRRD